MAGSVRGAAEMFRGLGVAVVGGEDVGLVAGPPFFAYAGGVALFRSPVTQFEI